MPARLPARLHTDFNPTLVQLEFACLQAAGQREVRFQSHIGAIRI